MENDNSTPGSAMGDAEYKEYIVQKYGALPGLAKTLLMIRKSTRSGETGANNSADCDDYSSYREIRSAIDEARKTLSRLHLRLVYSEKNRSFADIPYEEIGSTIECICSELCKLRQNTIEPCIAVQKEAYMHDYEKF